jgi:hypothetical protein
MLRTHLAQALREDFPMSDPGHIDTVHFRHNTPENSSSFSAARARSQTARLDGCEKEKLDVFGLAAHEYQQHVAPTTETARRYSCLGWIKKTSTVEAPPL